MKAILRVIALAITLVMLFSVFVACEQNNNGGVNGETKDELNKGSESDSSTGETNIDESNDQIENGTDTGNKNNNTDGGNDNNIGSKDDITAEELAINAYNVYINDEIADDELAKFMIYDTGDGIVALQNGNPVDVYDNRDDAIKALLGDYALPFCEVEETFVEALFYCVMLETYSYPLDTLSEPTAAIDSYKDGKYVANGNRYASLIPLSELDYDKVTIKNGSQNGTPNLNFAYTFLAEEPVLNQMPVYAKGYSYVIVVEPMQSLTINIPEDAVYLYIYHHTRTGKYYFPNEVIFSRKVNPENSFTLATWNTGNFSGGGKNTTITEAQLEEKQKLYTDYIENRLNADLICLNEFDPNFTTSGNYATKDILFPEYVDYVGTKYGYQCNSMFAKSSLTMTAPQANNFGNGYGYYATDVTVGGKMVTVVSVHLNYDHNYVKGTTDEINKEQIMDVLEIFANKERVIFLGDWNCIQFKQYELLIDAGYTLANTDPKLSTKTGNAIENFSLDNIAYKGVTISNFTCEITDLSDHYALRCTVSVD